MSKSDKPSKLDQIRALREAKPMRVTRVPVKPAGMKPLAADFKKQPEIVAVSAARRGAGRPLASEAHLSNEQLKPWIAAKMSRRTWYRRQAVKRR